MCVPAGEDDSQGAICAGRINEIDVPKTTLLLSEGGSPAVDFVWENTPGLSRKALREAATVYSHIAHAQAVLEDKWSLALIGDAALASAGDTFVGLLPSHCFRGKAAVAAWCEVRWGGSSKGIGEGLSADCAGGGEEDGDLWVLKDAESNGAGGIWVLSRHRWRALCGVAPAPTAAKLPETPAGSAEAAAEAATGAAAEAAAEAAAKAAAEAAAPTSPLHDGHRYVAQRYVGAGGAAPTLAGIPGGGAGGGELALWKGRKFHVRAYAVSPPSPPRAKGQ